MIGKMDFILTPKVLNRPAVKATADQLAETHRIVWSCVSNGAPLPKKYSSGTNLAQWANDNVGYIFKKSFFTNKLVLTKHGKRWVKDCLHSLGLSGSATLGEKMFRTIGLLKNMK